MHQSLPSNEAPAHVKFGPRLPIASSVIAAIASSVIAAIAAIAAAAAATAIANTATATPHCQRRWFLANLGFTAFVVVFLAFQYTQHVCQQRTEFINAGKILGTELEERDWKVPDRIKHLVSQRQGYGGKNYTFISWKQNYGTYGVTYT